MRSHCPHRYGARPVHHEVVVPEEYLSREPELRPILHGHARAAWRPSEARPTPAGDGEQEEVVVHPGWGIYSGSTTHRLPKAGLPYAVDPSRPVSFCPHKYGP